MFKFYRKSPVIEPSTTILSYTAESDVIYAPDHEHVESRYRQIWQCFNTGNLLKAREKAYRTFKKEFDRFSGINSKFPEEAEGSPFRGLKLYFLYKLGGDRKGETYRFDIFDGQDVSLSEIEERMERETMFLGDAGVDIEQIKDERFWMETLTLDIG